MWLSLSSGSLAYVTNGLSNSVSAIDLSTNTIGDTIESVVTTPVDVGITPNQNFAYVVTNGSDDVTVIDLDSNAIVETIPVGIDPSDIAITPDGNFAYVTNSGGTTVSIIDLNTNTVVETITVGTQPLGIALNANQSLGYVVNLASANVSVINLNSNMVVGTITVGASPRRVALSVIPPLSVVAKSKGDVFLTQTSLFNEVRWSKPACAITSFQLYADAALTQLIAEFGPDVFEYIERGENGSLPNNTTFTYVVIAFNGTTEVARGSATVRTKNP